MIHLLLHQSYLHLFSYALVLSILLVAVADGILIRQLRRVLRVEGDRLREGALGQDDWDGMVHPAVPTLRQLAVSNPNPSVLRRQADLAEAALFVPLRSRMTLTRDLSTLMGLIPTLLALVAAASDFARNGKPELLVGSVGTGCVATCVAAIGCAIALWNLSRLTRLRLETACATEEVLRQVEAREGAIV